MVDALDKIEDRGGSAFLEELLRMIYKSHLQGIKFLITSRPDADLAKLCSSFTPDAICALYDGMAVVNDLMHQADGLFIFAATVVRYITRRPMTKHEQIRLLGKLGIRADGSTCIKNVCMLFIRFSAPRNVYPPPLVENSIPAIQTQHASFPVIISSQAR